MILNCNLLRVEVGRKVELSRCPQHWPRGGAPSRRSPEGTQQQTPRYLIPFARNPRPRPAAAWLYLNLPDSSTDTQACAPAALSVPVGSFMSNFKRNQLTICSIHEALGSLWGGCSRPSGLTPDALGASWTYKAKPCSIPVVTSEHPRRPQQPGPSFVSSNCAARAGGHREIQNRDVTKPCSSYS